MYAIVETGGKQYKLEEGRYVDIELVDGEENDKVVFDKVVMLVNGAKSKVGAPYVDKASVEGKIVKHDKDKKVIVARGETKGRIAKEPGPMGKLTYGPIFISDEFGKVMNELTAEQLKHTHREKALIELLKKLNKK